MTKLGWIVSSILFLSSSTAFGQEVSHKQNASLTAGGGVTSFSSGTTSDAVDLGYLWELRASLGLSSMLAVEGAYLRSYYDISIPAVNASITGDSVEGLLRVSIGNYAVQPYVFGGLGWTRYHIDIPNTSAGLSSSDDIFNLPVGAGFSMMAGSILIDFRGTFRFAFDDELLVQEGNLNNYESLNTWGATIRAGLAF